MTYKSLDLIYPPFKQVILDALLKQGEFVPFETFRTFSRQAELFNNGASKSQAGMSWHNYGLAVDFVTIKDGHPSWEGNYKLLWDAMNQDLVEWSGLWTHFPERCHFQWKTKIPISKAKQTTFRDGVLGLWAELPSG